MSGEEIKKKIDFCNAQLELIEEYSIAKFILNPKAEALLKEIENLTKVCPHSFNEDNICIYCGIGKEEIDEY